MKNRKKSFDVVKLTNTVIKRHEKLRKETRKDSHVNIDEAVKRLIGASQAVIISSMLMQAFNVDEIITVLLRTKHYSDEKNAHARIMRHLKIDDNSRIKSRNIVSLT